MRETFNFFQLALPQIGVDALWIIAMIAVELAQQLQQAGGVSPPMIFRPTFRSRPDSAQLLRCQFSFSKDAESFMATEGAVSPVSGGVRVGNHFASIP